MFFNAVKMKEVEGLQKHTLGRRVRVQFVSRDTTEDGISGSNTYRLSLLRHLKTMGFDIQYLFLGYRGMAFTHKNFNYKTISGVTTDVVSPPWNSGNDISAWGDPPSPLETKYFRRRFKSYQPDIVIIDRVWLAKLLEEIPSKKVLKVILTHDVAYERISAFQAAGLNPFKKMGGFKLLQWDKATESVHLRKAHILLAIQQDDLKSLQRMAPKSEVILTPMATKPHFHQNSKQVPGRCLFVGGSASHNVDGLKWFLQKIWPLIRKRVPFASLHVCGDVCYSFTAGLLQPQSKEGVSFLGNIKDLNVEYEQTQVFISPIRVGSGLKIKLIEALSHGRACVTTRCGVQGLKNISNYGVIVEDRADDFSVAVCRLIKNTSERRVTETKAREYVTNHLSPFNAYMPLIRRLHQHTEAKTRKRNYLSFFNFVNSDRLVKNRVRSI